MYFYLFACLFLAIPMTRAGQDVWYDASGKVFGVTPTPKESKTWIPDWKKRENARLKAQRERNSHRGVQRSWRSPYGSYPVYYGYGGRCYRSHYSSWRFRGAYHGNGWSVRVKF